MSLDTCVSSGLAGFVPNLQVTELGSAAGYLAVGHARGPLDTIPQSDTQQ
jgi:hypothetical protein